MCAWIVVLLVAAPAAATVVRFETTLGDIDVRLYDGATPASVVNFLNYVVDDDYDGSFFHRAPLTYRVDSQGNYVYDDNDERIVDTFVLQGGGYTYTAEAGLGYVPTDDPVVNEPGISNLPGTLAYAKLGGDPDSATSGFFFNTSNNVNNLDNQNGGFTVFGRIVAGQASLDAITELSIADLDGSSASTFDTVPVINFVDPLEEILVYLDDVRILDLPAGDYDFDGDVDGDDYAVFANSFGSTIDAAADGNGDGVVDAADFAVWRDSMAIAAAAVPEPSTVTMLGVVIAVQLRRRLR